jgi:SNF2 family DNA or RNA helicase
MSTALINERMKLFDKYLEYANMDKKSYQAEGVRWCLTSELRPNPPCNVRGGFIADEMGLGKTIMMIGTFFANFLTRTLIVLPPILLEQWSREIYRTTGHRPLVYHGLLKKEISLEQLNKAPIVITTYGAISLRKKEVCLLHKVVWSRIVFDEAHHLRNKKTVCFAGAMLLKSNIRWLVSGTPVQNSKKDFYALCSALKLPCSFYADSSNLPLLAKSFILKRTKKQVGIQLPDLTVSRNVVQWKNNKEKMLSEVIHSALTFSNVYYKPSECDGIINGIPLVMLLRARQSCILPKLMEGSVRYLSNRGIIKDAGKFKEALKHSSKLDSVIDSIVERKGNGNGKIVFCHFKEEIDEIVKRLLRRGFTSVAVFDGRVKVGDKNNILNADNEVLILQIQTGCEGLNLQKNYSEIYFVSPHWNPAVEDQAIARCHRIGQTKKVSVMHFQMEEFDKDYETVTVDKHVCVVQDIKRSIAEDCIPLLKKVEQKNITDVEKLKEQKENKKRIRKNI